MGLDDEIGAARMTTRDMRWGTHLALAALVAAMLMLTGLMTQAMAGPHPFGAHPAAAATTGTEARTTTAADRLDVPFADQTIHTGGIPIAEGRALIELSRAASADRHIQIGILLVIVALMATTTFSLWRWQLRGLVSDAANRDA